MDFYTVQDSKIAQGSLAIAIQVVTLFTFGLICDHVGHGDSPTVVILSSWPVVLHSVGAVFQNAFLITWHHNKDGPDYDILPLETNWKFAWSLAAIIQFASLAWGVQSGFISLHSDTLDQTTVAGVVLLCGLLVGEVYASANQKYAKNATEFCVVQCVNVITTLCHLLTFVCTCVPINNGIDRLVFASVRRFLESFLFVSCCESLLNYANVLQRNNLHMIHITLQYLHMIFANVTVIVILIFIQENRNDRAFEPEITCFVLNGCYQVGCAGVSLWAGFLWMGQVGPPPVDESDSDDDDDTDSQTGSNETKTDTDAWPKSVLNASVLQRKRRMQIPSLEHPRVDVGMLRLRNRRGVRKNSNRRNSI